MIDVMQELKTVGEDYKSGEFSRGILRLKEIWNSIPVPKVDTPNAYMLIEYGVTFAMKLNDLDKAWEWASFAPAFREKREDRGEVEFLVGKVAYERGEMDVAKENFLVAKKKSKGRIFQGVDPKYQKLIR